MEKQRAEKCEIQEKTEQEPYLRIKILPYVP